jgi:hypothetical protein
MAMKDISDKQVCEAYAEYGENRESFPYEILARITGQPEKVCYRATERAQDRGFIECGVSLRTGWLTTSGKKLLAVEEE